VTSELVGCLDADSFVVPDALIEAVKAFEASPEAVAITPAMKVHKPRNLVELMQAVEYTFGIFYKKMFDNLSAINVLPGPFSIYKRAVFSQIGPFRHAHNTEDLEMALRIQEHHYKIKNAHKALVYTVGPRTLYKLYKQRVRWTGGFLQNSLDYKRLVFNPKYGNFGLLVLPVTLLTAVCSLFLLFYSLFRMSQSLMQSVTKMSIVGIHFRFSNPVSYDWILFHIQATSLFSVLSVGLIVFSVWYGKKISGDKGLGVLDTVYFLTLYSLISTFWLVTSFYNTIRHRDASWR